MNRSVCGVMVSVAGLAVLGMTATLAAVQTNGEDQPWLFEPGSRIDRFNGLYFRCDVLVVPHGTNGTEIVSLGRSSFR